MVSGNAPPLWWSLGGLIMVRGVPFRTTACADTFVIATREGAERDTMRQLIDARDVIKVGKGNAHDGLL